LDRWGLQARIRIDFEYAGASNSTEDRGVLFAFYADIPS
jgi:hypothetical protein